MHNDNNKLPAYSDMGGYEINYVGDGIVLCSDCANKKDECDKKELAQYIHWEGDSTYCDDCNYKIESIYGEY